MATHEQLMTDLASMGGSDHTALMMDSFILVANGHTTYGQYRQALRQLHTLISGVASMQRDLKRLDIDAKEALNTIGEERVNRFQLARLELDVEEAEFNAALMREKIQSKTRELNHFTQAASTLRDELGADFQDPEVQRRLEEAHWVELYIHDAALSLQVNGSVPLGLMRDIVALPKDLRSEIMMAISKPAQIVSDLGQHDAAAIVTQRRRTLGDGTRTGR